MKIGVRGKLFLVSLGLIGVALGVGGSFLSYSLRQQLETKIESELAHLARVCRAWLESLPGPQTIEGMTDLAQRIGRSTDVRVTIVARDGRVLGDSDLNLAQVRAVENHGQRPEIRQAMEAGQGEARRYSTTLDTDMLYLALPYDGPSGAGVVRVARELSEVDGAIDRLRWLMLLGAALALGAALLLSMLASHYYSRTLRRLVARARELSEGSSGQRLPTYGGDEISQLSGSIHRMSEALSQVMVSLASERDRFETVLEGMADGVLAIDGDRRVTHANSTAIALLDRKESPVGLSLAETVRAAKLHEALDGAGPGRSTEVEFDLRSDPPKRILARSAPQRSGEGQVIVFQDVTGLRHLERVRKDFVANVSHELRTPVSIIRANAETLLAGALRDPDKATEFLQALHRNAERLSTLIDDLLDISRIDSGRVALERERIDLPGVVAAVAQTLAPVAEERGIQIQVALGEQAAVRADEKALHQVLSNLLDNAIKYSRQGGSVQVTSRVDDGRVRVEVRDDGPGIDPRLRGRVFERFFRVDKGRSREMGGTGLGLSIVKNLIESMDGSVGLEANKPQGCVFWFALPTA